MQEEIYTEICRLTCQNKFDDALNLIFDEGNQCLKDEFKNYDLNHVWYVVANLYFQKRMYDRALYFFQKSFEFDKNDQQALFAIGNCYSELNLIGDAIGNYKKALRLDPNNFSIIYNLGNAYFDLRFYRRAIYFYKQVCREKTDSETFRLAQSNIRRSMKKLVDKKEKYRR